MRQFLFRVSCAAFVFCAVAAFSLSAAQEDGFVSLFNGTDLSGWTVKGGDGKYHVEDGSIVGTVNDERRNTFLCSEKEFENFVLKVQFKYDRNFNSGIQFRSRARTEGERQRVYGYQCEIDTGGMTGGIYDEARRGRWLNTEVDLLRKKAIEAFLKDDWNELEIQCVGPSIRTWLNGRPISNLMDTVTDSGFIGLQVHAAKSPGAIRWRNVRIKELPSTPWVSFFKDKQFVDLEIKPAGTWTFDEDGVTVRATSPPGTVNDGLVLSAKTYDNFAARISFKRESGNSGLYFRAVEVDKTYWVRGFQAEIEGDHRAGGLWEVEGRGWVFQPTEEANGKIIKPTEWNDLSVVAVGDRLVTNLNGTQLVDMVDPDCLKQGKTGIQLHGGGGVTYWFKHYDIKPLSKEMVERITRE